MVNSLPPDDAAIRALFPEIGDLALLDLGGFKYVFRAQVGASIEAFKLVELPPIGLTEVDEAYRIEATSRVMREIKVLGECKSPELVKLASIAAKPIRIGSQDYVGYSEEFVQGGNLASLIANAQLPLPTEVELRLLFRCLLTAIGEMWGNGYIHRDIKPKNVMKTGDDRRPFVLLDLGIAHSVRETSLTYNPTGRLPLATYRYMAPERAYPDQRENLDYRSDLYSAAVTIYEYASRHHPITDRPGDPMETISRIVHLPTQALEHWRPDLSAEFRQLVDQSLKKRPGLRPGNLKRLISFLEGG